MDNNLKNKKDMYSPFDSAKMYAFVLLTSLAISVIASSILIIISKATGTEVEIIQNSATFNYLFPIFFYGIIFSLFLLYNKTNNFDWENAIKIKQKSNFLTIFICFLIGLVFVYLTSPIIDCYAWLIELTGLNAPTELGFPINNVAQLFLAIIVSAFLPAIVEEIIFRGVILNGLRNKGKWFAIIISALAFSLMHTSIFQLPYTFIFGILLGLIYWETNTLWLTMIIHFVSNTQVLINVYLVNNGIISGTTTVSFGYFLIGIALLAVAIGLVYLSIYIIRKKQPNNLKTNNENLLFEQDNKNKIENLNNDNKTNEENKTRQYWILAFVVAILLLILGTLG